MCWIQAGLLLQTDLICLLCFPEPPKPPETPQAKQFAHLPAEADNLKSKRRLKRHLHLEEHQKMPFCLNSSIIWRSEYLHFPSNLLSALHHKLQTRCVQQTHLVTSHGQDTTGSALIGGLKLFPGVLQPGAHQVLPGPTLVLAEELPATGHGLRSSLGS